MSDGALAMSDQLSREELLQVLTQISSTGRPALMYQIVRQRRGHKYRRQQGWSLGFFMYILTLVMMMYYYDMIRTLWYFYDIFVPFILFLAFYFYHVKIIFSFYMF